MRRPMRWETPTGLLLTPGQASDLEGADALSPDLKARTLLADKAYDADERALDPLRQAGKTAVIPPNVTEWFSVPMTENFARSGI